MDKKELREWAQAVSQEDGSAGRMSVDIAIVKAAADYIKETLPEPTMDEIGWSDERHRFAVARGDRGEELVMLGPIPRGGKIYCLDLATKQIYWLWDDQLTPTGEKYILQGEGDGAQ